MRRRDLIVGLGLAAWPVPGRAEPPGKVWRIGFVGLGPSYPGSIYPSFLRGMSELGYVEGKDFLSEHLPIEEQYDLASQLTSPAQAAELVRRNCDVLLSGITPAVRALQLATRTIPIVFVGVTDPVGTGLVASLARPGGNTTGLASSNDDASPKQLELLAMIVPAGSRIGMLRNPGDPATEAQLRITQNAGTNGGIALVVKDATNIEQIENAFAAFVRERVAALMIPANAAYFFLREQIARLAFNHRLPAMYPERDYVEAGGLMSYGQSRRELWRQAATYVHKLMRGATPADLPVEQPTRFALTINQDG